jgi:CCR4-NOT transcriptional complex subunit CAF120
MWSMKETRAAAAKGEKVPPTYFNITDSSLELLAPLPPPPHRPNSHPHHYVFSLNTAGSNRLLFSCPSERDLAKWTTGLRLAAWERARLEELYTGHLIKSAGKEPKSEVFRGRMEGWVRVRVMGGVDWKRLWVVLSTPGGDEAKEDEKKGRRRSFFGNKPSETVQEPNTGISMASFYLEPRTQKNKTSPAVLTITNVTQA